MRILTVRQPWAWAIIHGGKDVENRVRNLAGEYRGPVAIHVGLAFPYTRDCKAVRDLVGSWPQVTDRWDRVLGAGHIIGLVDLVGVHKGLAPSRVRMESVDSCYRAGKPFGACSPWAEAHAWHLELVNPRPLAEPIPYRGALGLRTLDDDTTARILAQIGA